MQDDAPDRLVTRGPELWCELHRWALTSDRSGALRWLARFETRIGCGDCRRHWQALVCEQPPDFASSETLFAWSVRMHNAVNRRLNKPEISVNAAAAYWRDRQCREAVAGHGEEFGRRSQPASPCRGCGGKKATQSEGKRI